MRQVTDEMTDTLCSIAASQGLVLCVGAGVNGGAALQWGGLLDGLLDAAAREFRYTELGRTTSQADELFCRWMGQYDSCAKALIAKQILGDQYAKVLRSLLYGFGAKYDPEDLRDYCRKHGNRPADDRGSIMDGRYSYLYRIALLCQTHAVRAVITFNYDCFLEAAINCTGEGQGRRAVCVVDHASIPVQSRDPTDIPVYHVHGCLPQEQITEPRGDSVVLALDEYLASMRNPMAWSTATPLHLLREHCCLFMGVSFRDWNMLRLAEAACNGRKLTHCYCIMSDEDLRCDGVPTVAAERLHGTLLDAVGVQLIIAGTQRQQARQYIGELACSIAARSAGWQATPSGLRHHTQTAAHR